MGLDKITDLQRFEFHQVLISVFLLQPVIQSASERFEHSLLSVVVLDIGGVVPSDFRFVKTPIAVDVDLV
jgi:hypothetical protein